MRNPSHDERISSFLDDALPASERSAFEAELRTNSELEQQVAELRQLRSDVALLPRYSVTEGFAQRVVAAAVAAKADVNATITPVSQPKSQPVRFSKVARGVVIGMAIAASAAILMISLPWLNFGENKPIPVATNTNQIQNQGQGGNNIEKVANATEPKSLDIVWSSLPGNGEAQVIIIRTAQGAAAGVALKDALVENGILGKRPSENVGAGVVFQVYKKHAAELTGNDSTKSTPAAAALYLEVSREELESVLTQFVAAEKKVEFVPAERLALAKPMTPEGQNTAAAEDVPPLPPGPGQYVELNPSRYLLPKSPSTVAVGPVTSQITTPSSKVRVLILVEEVK